MLENGLLETLVKALVASAHVSDPSSQDLIILDIYYFFVIIVNQVLNTPGIHNMQVRISSFYLSQLFPSSQL